MITNFPNGISSFGVPLIGGAQLADMSGTIYFVDGNAGNDGNDGLSWDYPKKTLLHTFSVSHTDIARGSDRWARRNTIFIAGDSFTETLTAFPQKTDVIGVGSYNGHKGASICGNHAPVNSAVGTRFINVNFEPVTAADIMTLTGATWGAEFIGCSFKAQDSGDSGIIAISAIQFTACPHDKVINCEFIGAFTGDVIDIAAGAASSMVIKGNTIIGGANDGIVVSGVATISKGRRGLIADNYIDVAAKTIDTRATSVFNCVNNRCISANAVGVTSYVIDASFAAGNVITGAGAAITIPDLLGRTS